MENLENRELTPESDTAAAPQPETPAEAQQAPSAPQEADTCEPTEETSSVTEAVPVAEAIPTEEATFDVEEAVPNVEEVVPDVEEVAPDVEEAAPDVEEAAWEPQQPAYEYDSNILPAQEAPPAPKSKCSFGKLILACTIIAGMVLGGCFLTGTVVSKYWQYQNQKLQEQLTALQGKTDRLQTQIQNSAQNNTGSNNNNSGNTGTPGADGLLTPTQVYAQNVGAVVYITTNSASGSGFIVTDNGYVVTNYHVVENAIKVTVTLSNSDTYSAKVVGYDATHDVAVLKVEATGLPYAVLGSSDALAVGDQITVIGNPLGELTYTQTVGYISGKDRGISTDNIITNMLQTDASINSGNSGGPMFNMKGEVVGIITAKYSGTSSSGASIEGIGFAIPIDDVSKKIQDLIEFGYISGAYLGVSVREMDKSVSQSFGIPMGAYVVTVEKTNCAYAAGVQEKDIIIGLGEYTIGSLNDLSAALQNFRPGDVTTITVWRSGTELELTITLDDRPH